MGLSFRGALAASACALSLVALASGSARAESLADAVADAYQTSPSLQQQRAQLRITDEGYVQARAGYRPQASGQVSATWRWSHLGKANCGLINPIPGCDLTPETNSGQALLSLDQPLYTGGRTSARVRSAEAAVLAGREDLRRVENTVMLSVVQAYVNVRRDEQALDIRRENVAVLQRQVDEVRARFDVGEVTRTDVAQSEAQLAAAQSAFAGAQAQLAISRAAYATVVGHSPARLDPEPPFNMFPDTVEQAFATAERNSPSIRGADYAEQSADAQVAEAKAQRLPTINAQANYSTAQPIHPWQTNLFDRELTAGVVLNQPIFSGGQVSSQIRESQERRNIARIDLEQSRRTVTEDISRAWDNLLASRAAIEAGQEQVRAARIAFEGTRAEQQVGLRTTLEVLSAQQVLRDAQLSLINARHDEYLASAGLLQTMGLLEARNLVPNIDQLPGSHAIGQLHHAMGYVPWEDGVAALDSVTTSRHATTLPPPLDAPIATSALPAAAAPAGPGASPEAAPSPRTP